MTPFLTAMTVLCVLGISLGQLLFKKAAAAIPDAMSLQSWIFNPWLIAALVLYGITTLAWVWVLRNATLQLAYPFMGLAFLIVPALEWLFMSNPIKLPTLIGGALILAGIAIAARA
ncbi:hypothetical protein G7047_18805 [Diaphorobacter sp. HDW4A]|uniref:hypothetical protein n=1 Tax=Diaphorobacter sp. HDW4A TaxID=2714924 RepID=UPI0014084CBB|nr:hypothetical protein [Diaphorobacter sp. HDW4A]QIL81737.1 hypothetical protein G7047_18805 [Diaphorobacter sp. HDW4A]